MTLSVLAGKRSETSQDVASRPPDGRLDQLATAVSWSILYLVMHAF